MMDVPQNLIDGTGSQKITREERLNRALTYRE